MLVTVDASPVQDMTWPHDSQAISGPITIDYPGLSLLKLNTIGTQESRRYNNELDYIHPTPQDTQVFQVTKVTPHGLTTPEQPGLANLHLTKDRLVVNTPLKDNEPYLLTLDVYSWAKWTGNATF